MPRGRPRVVALHGGPVGPRPPEDDLEDISVAALNARMRAMASQALDEVGGVEYLKKVAAKNSGTFLRFIAQFATREETLDPGAFQIVINKITLTEAQPVAGVISSPVAGHISMNGYHAGGAGPVVDAEPRDA